MKLNKSILVFAILLITLSSFGQSVEFKLVTQKNISAFSEIQIIRDELFLGSETVDRILISDILNDGFDENDVLQLYPSGRVLRLQPISSRLDSLLRSYRLPPNSAIFESRHYFAEYDTLAMLTRGGRALGYGLLGGIEQRLQRGYRGDMIEGYFKVTPNGANIQIWNFDSTRVNFPPPDPNPRDTIIIYQSDTVYVSEVVTIEQDPIVIRDTVWLPADLRRDDRQLYYREALGMAGGGFSMAKRESSRGRLILGAGNEWDFGVWDHWISGRQDINSRVGLKFIAEMAPWKSDTLSPRFLGTSAEVLYIPAWDRSFFAFAGIRTYYHDDLFWDRARAAWDPDRYVEPHEQDLTHYEFTAKVGLDKLSPYGTGKKVGLWLKLSGWVGDSGYDIYYDSKQEGVDRDIWRFEHEGGFDVEGAATVRLGERAQFALSVGQLSIPNLNYDVYGEVLRWTDKGLMRVAQIYQTAAIRFTPHHGTDSRLRLEAMFRNNTLSEKFKQGNSNDLVKEVYFPYFETPEIGAKIEYDYNIVTVSVGVRAFFPPNGLDTQVQPYGGLHFMFR